MILGAAVTLVVAALVTRLFTSGAGIELHQPGAQILFDVLALCGCFSLILGRVLAGEAPLARTGWPLPALVAFSCVLVVTAARAPQADLAARTALSWTAMLLLALTLRDLGKQRASARLLAAFLVAALATAALLGIYEYAVAQPAALAAYERGGLDAELGLQGRGLRIAVDERIHSRAAMSSFLLPGLFASALISVLPLALASAWASWRARRSPGAVLFLPGAVAAVIALCLALVLTRSKGAVVSVVGVLAVASLLHPRLEPHRKALALAAGVAAGALGLLGLIVFYAGPERLGIGLSLQVRLEYWSAGLGMWRDHPLLGAGLNAFRDLFSAYKSARAEEALHAHNAAVQLLAETGIVGALAFVALLFSWARAGVRAALAPSEEADRPPRKAEPTLPGAEPSVGSAPVWAKVGLGLGLGLGLVLLAGFGDVYDASPQTLGHLVVIALGLGLGTPLLQGALARVAPRVLAASALAGASVLLWDGLLNFGLHQAGVFVLTFSLAALAPCLAGATLDWTPPRSLRLSAAAAIGLLCMGVLLGKLPTALLADTERALARQAHEAGALALSRGRREEGLRELRLACERYAAATEGYPGDVRTWLEQSAALDNLATAAPESPDSALLRQRALASARRATELDPWAADAWSQLGHLRDRGPHADLRAVIAAYDEAVRRYPFHPTYSLEAGEARARLLAKAPPTERPQLIREARRLLEAALAASEATRLVRLKLTEEQASRIKGLLERLGGA